MELRQLRYFAAVAKERSFKRASEVLYIAQPAVSRQVCALEAELGVALLNRTTRGVETTPAGRMFLAKAESILADVASLRDGLRQIPDTPSGLCTIGLPPSLAALVARPLFAEVSALFPQVTLRIVESSSAFLADALRDGKLDLTLLTYTGALPEFEIEELADEEIVFLCGRAGAPAGRKDIAVAALENFTLVITHGFRNLLQPLLLKERLELNFRMELDSLGVVAEMVEGPGFGSVVSHAWASEAVAARRSLRTLRIGDGSLTRKIVLATLPGATDSCNGRAVSAILRQIVRALPLRPPAVSGGRQRLLHSAR